MIRMTVPLVTSVWSPGNQLFESQSKTEFRGVTTDEDPLDMEHPTAGLNTRCQHWTEDLSDWMDLWLTTRMATVVWGDFSLGKFRPHSKW